MRYEFGLMMRGHVYTFLCRHKIAACALVLAAVGPHALWWIMQQRGMTNLGDLLCILGLLVNAVVVVVALLLLALTRGAIRESVALVGCGALLSLVPFVIDNLPGRSAETPIPVFLDAYCEGTQGGQSLTCYRDGTARYSISGAFDFLLRDEESRCSGSYLVSNGVLHLSFKHGPTLHPPTELRFVTGPGAQVRLTGMRRDGLSPMSFVINNPTNFRQADGAIGGAE